MSRFDLGLKGLKEAAGNDEPVAPSTPVQVLQERMLPPSRVGKVSISAYFDPAVRKQFAILATIEEKSQAALLADALNLLFEKHGKPPIASA